MNSKLQLLLSCVLTFFLTQEVSAQQQNYEVSFHSGVAQLSENFKSEVDQLTAAPEEIFEGYYSRFVQFYSNPNQLERKAIENMGLHFLGYVPNKTYLMSIPEGFDWNQLTDANIRSVVAIDPILKLDSKLVMELSFIGDVFGEQIELMLGYSDVYNAEQIEAACLANGITVKESSRYSPIMKVYMPLDKVAENASLPFINFMEVAPGPPVPDDLRGRSLHRCNLVDSEYANGYHFNGEGVNVQIRDDGEIGPHIDFTGRVDNSYQPAGSGSHETRVAGTAGGAGNLNPFSRGMADGMFMFGTDYEESFFDVTMDLHFNEGVVITNSSYSNGCNAGYQTNSATVDEQIHDNPTLIHVFSAGNSNNQNCGYGAGNQWGNITGGHKVGKNVIATANIFFDGEIVGSSSRGPAEDGRIKPDLSAQGAVFAPLPNNQYENTSGTSFSSPSVVGVLAQLYQAYKTWNNGVNPPSALLKAALLNTANDLGNKGPDFIFGWGHLNSYRALKTIEEVRYFTDEIEDGLINQHDLTIPENLQQIKIMVYWSDVPGNTFANKALVNDLDIQLVSPDGTVMLPYLLDHSPSPVALNLPAANGEDHLNNVEQVAIDNPVAGVYTLTVNGFDVPMGPQEYYVLWEEVTDEIMLTHPVGGECLTTEQGTVIHWDAYGTDDPFLLEYSNNDGLDWVTIATVSGSTRNYDWTAPLEFTGKGLVRISNSSGEDVSDANFSWMDAPSNVEVIGACPDLLTLTWDTVPGAVGYIAYVLGDQYMDSVAFTTTNEVNVPVINSMEENWYAVSSIGPDGACSPRNIAQVFSGDIFNCMFDNDVTLAQSNICTGTNYICEPFEDALTLNISNIGISSQSNMSISYSLNNGPVFTESFAGPLMAGETTPFTFANPLNPNATGANTVIAWVDAAVDDYQSNDTLSISFDFVLDPVTAPVDYSEDFETVFPAMGWTLVNVDGSTTWGSRFVVGAFDDDTEAMYINNYTYNDIGQKDKLISIPIDLTGASNPWLSFDVAHARFISAAFIDTLHVELQTICNADCGIDIVFSKSGTTLSTHAPSSSNWLPDSGADWRNELIDLNPYAGETIILTFVNSTGSGNSVYFDNINVVDATEPVAEFDLSTTEDCVFQPITFTGNTSGTITSYAWDFGEGAEPATSSAPGPIDVAYTTPGTKTITLVTSGPLGMDTYTFDMLEISPQPEASFTFTELDETYTFTNTSLLGNSYEWDFGDGSAISTEENPVHTYTASGEYDITLTVTNDCGTVSTSTTVSIIIIGTSDLNDNFQIALSPNPGTDEVIISVKNNSATLNQIQLYNTSGQIVKTLLIDQSANNENYRVETTDLPVGAYWFKLMFEEGTESKRWIKM